MPLTAMSRKQRIEAAIYILDSLITDYPPPCTYGAAYDEHLRQSTRVASILESLVTLQSYEES